MRILVADAQHSNRLSIETMLNRMGYFRIAPVSSFDEICVLVQCAIEPFDLLIINDDLSREAGVDAIGFCQGSAMVRNALAYNRSGSPSTHIPRQLGDSVMATLMGLPAFEAINCLMHTLETLALSHEPMPLQAGD